MGTCGWNSRVCEKTECKWCFTGNNGDIMRIYVDSRWFNLIYEDTNKNKPRSNGYWWDMMGYLSGKPWMVSSLLSLAESGDLYWPVGWTFICDHNWNIVDRIWSIFDHHSPFFPCTYLHIIQQSLQSETKTTSTRRSKSSSSISPSSFKDPDHPFYILLISIPLP